MGLIIFVFRGIYRSSCSDSELILSFMVRIVSFIFLAWAKSIQKLIFFSSELDM